jgi:NAD(P)-dependent dehydrogenase (short-subunit alcohol dehydrogenase family)
MKIRGSTVLLTGANGGMGQAFVEELLKRGVEKLYAGDLPDSWRR